MRIGLPNGKMLAGIREVLESSGITIQRDHERSCSGKLCYGGERHTLHIARPDGLYLLWQGGVLDVVLMGLDKLCEEAGGLKQLNAELHYFPHVSRKGLPTAVVLFSRKQRWLRNGDRIVTEYPEITRAYLQTVGLDAEILRVSGSAESLVAAGFGDFGVALNESGDTIRANRLHPITTILDTTPVLASRPGDQNAHEFCSRLSSRLLPAPP